MLVVKNLPTNGGRQEMWVRFPSILGRFPGGGNGNPPQYSCLENPINRGAWQATVHRVVQSWTQLKRLSTAHLP